MEFSWQLPQTGPILFAAGMLTWHLEQLLFTPSPQVVGLVSMCMELWQVMQRTFAALVLPCPTELLNSTPVFVAYGIGCLGALTWQS